MREMREKPFQKEREVLQAVPCRLYEGMAQSKNLRAQRGSEGSVDPIEGVRAALLRYINSRFPDPVAQARVAATIRDVVKVSRQWIEANPMVADLLKNRHRN